MKAFLQPAATNRIMSIKPPKLSHTFLITDDARAAAVISCAFAQKGEYFPVVDGPRMARPDRNAEIIRRNNCVARSGARRVVLAGLPPDALSAMTSALPSGYVVSPRDNAAIKSLLPVAVRAKTPLLWGRDHIGLGVLRALRAGKCIAFDDRVSDTTPVNTRSGHLVVCEAGDDLSEVIAANYAFSLEAGLVIIPRIPNEAGERILDALYGLYDLGSDAPQALEKAIAMLRQFGGVVPSDGGSITFFARKLPLGLGYPEVPSTHLFTYPDLGLSVVNGFASARAEFSGDNVAVLIDPQTTIAPEIDAAAVSLSQRGMFVRTYKGLAANVRDIADAVEEFPYDLLVFATHCGDASGYRWTYEFDDSEGRQRQLVTDIAIGVGRPGRDDRLSVTQFTRFHALDGVDWMDEEAKAALPVGSAIADFMALIQGPGELEPTVKIDIKRVVGSAAMKMCDHNYIPLPRSLASNQTPVILNNACVSWHELSGRFTFGGARAYIGTLIEVTALEAQEVVTRLLGEHFDKSLPDALWASQRDVYGTGTRRPYVMTGVYPQWLRPDRQRDVPADILAKLASAKRDWVRRLAQARSTGDDAPAVDNLSAIVDYYTRELAGMSGRWKPAPGEGRQGIAVSDSN